MEGFRPGGNLAFDRLSDGSVVVARLQTDIVNKKTIVRHSHIIDPETWAGLITYVSKGGSDHDNFKERRRIAEWFHKGEELQAIKSAS